LAKPQGNPIEKVDGNLKVAMSDPMNIFSIDDLRLTTGLEIIPCLADEEQISAQLENTTEKLPGRPVRKK